MWGDAPHTELGYCFADVGADPDNRVIILTGTGPNFIAELDDSWVGTMTPDKWSKIYYHGRRLLLNLLDIEVPVIAAVNGPATVHAELALLSDIVLSSETPCSPMHHTSGTARSPATGCTLCGPPCSGRTGAGTSS